jgi:hypothetical protein
MMKTALGVFVAGLCLCTAEVASAQSAFARPWQDRFYFNFNYLAETESSDFTESRSFTLYEEQARMETNIDMPSDGVIDFSAGMRLWKNLSVGIGYSMQSSTGQGTVSGSLPHPLFFDRPRTFTDEIDGIDRDETGTHLIIGWTIPFSEKLDVMIAGGPSFFRVHQEVVSAVNAAETGPPFATVIVEPVITERIDSAWGGNIGADINYILVAQGRTRIGAGLTMRYASAQASLQLSSETQDTKVGGFQIGGGLRVRF